MENYNQDGVDTMTGMFDIAAVSKMLEQGRITVPELVSNVIAKATESQAIFTQRCYKTAIAEAIESQHRRENNRMRSPLDGIPIAIKDNLDLTGYPTTNGSASSSSVKCTESADIVYRLQALGLIIIGKTNLSELAFSGLGINTYFGTPDNKSKDGSLLIPGGSSSGSASAVSQRYVPIAIGTDTSGSIRIPASIQGIAGFRPSQQHFSREGCAALSPTLDTIGFLANNIKDISNTFYFLTQYPKQRLQPALKSKTLIVPEHEMYHGTSNSVRAHFEHCLKALKESGYEIVKKKLKALDEVNSLFNRYGTLVAHEAILQHKQLYTDKLDILQSFTFERLAAASLLHPDGLAKLLDARPPLIEQVADELKEDSLLTPTLPILPPRFAEVNNNEIAQKVNRLILRNTMIGSYLDMPSISIPTYSTSKHLSIGIMLSSVQGMDNALLHLGGCIEKDLKAFGF